MPIEFRHSTREGELYPGMPAIVHTIDAVDVETGRVLSSDEVRARFKDPRELVNLHVKRKFNHERGDFAGPKDLPDFGVVEHIGGLHVCVSGTQVPLERFYDWYELD